MPAPKQPKNVEGRMKRAARAQMQASGTGYLDVRFWVGPMDKGSVTIPGPARHAVPTGHLGQSIALVAQVLAAMQMEQRRRAKTRQE